MAALAATCLVSIVAAQAALALAAAVFITRLVRRETRLPRLALDGAILAFVVWTLLSASFSPEPVVSHHSAKKLVLFALLYLAVDTMADPERRDAVLDAALLGGLVLATGALFQYYFLGFDQIDRRFSEIDRRFGEVAHQLGELGRLHGDVPPPEPPARQEQREHRDPRGRRVRRD